MKKTLSTKPIFLTAPVSKVLGSLALVSKAVLSKVSLSRAFSSKTIVSGILYLLLSLLASPIHAVSGLSPFLIKQLDKARTLMETESWIEAKRYLEDLSTSTSNVYAKALIAQSLGQIAFYQDDYVLALKEFQNAYDSQVLEQNTQNNLLHSIAQLHCSIEQWTPCREKMQAWIKLSPDKVKANDYVIIAQAYASTDDWTRVVEPTKTAISLMKNAPLDWHRLEVVALSQLQRWPAAISAQENLISAYPNEANEWRKLVSLYLQIEDYSSALSYMRIPFERGLLIEERDYKQIARLMFAVSLPYQAAKTLSEGIEQGVLPEALDNLRLLSNMWLQAKEYDQAIAVLKKIVVHEPEKKWYRQLALLHFEKKQWVAASNLLEEAIDLGYGSELQLMLGVALLNQDKLSQAEKVLEPLRRDKKLGPRAENWLRYIDKVRT